LRQKFLDPEERVRTSAIKVFDEFDMETLGSVSMICLKDIAQRCRDKKVFILFKQSRYCSLSYHAHERFNNENMFLIFSWDQEWQR
jgi:hypothetical protein